MKPALSSCLAAVGARRLSGENMPKSMFERYGGFASVSKIVMAFYDKVLDSDIIGHHFEDVEMSRLIDHQTKFIASVMGGPAAYSDDALHRMHAHLKIDKAQFEEMNALLEETLEDFELEQKDIDEVMAHIRARAPYIITG
jgi:hemoglobin